LHIAAHLEIANFSASSGCIYRIKGRHNIDESRSVDPETVEHRKILTIARN
jgi:hypothetical protein